MRDEPRAETVGSLLRTEEIARAAAPPAPRMTGSSWTMPYSTR